MARRARFTPVGMPQHIIQRGVDRQLCFGCESDFKAYLYWLKEYSERYSVSIHAWVLMTNHVHLLCTPNSTDGISKMMQSLGRRYVRYFNYNYQRTGTLWEGRFKACVVNASEYLLHLYRYIELNPVRANMVKDPADYVWSSYQCNALGRKDLLLTPHELYLALDYNPIVRQALYRSLFTSHVEGALLKDIRYAVNKGLVLGSERFVAKLEALCGRRLKEGLKGRPKIVYSDPHLSKQTEREL
jgi:putative transposase